MPWMGYAAMHGLQYIAVLITMACNPFMINVLTCSDNIPSLRNSQGKTHIYIISITQIATDSAAWIALKPQRTKEHQTSILVYP